MLSSEYEATNNARNEERAVSLISLLIERVVRRQNTRNIVAMTSVVKRSVANHRHILGTPNVGVLNASLSISMRGNTELYARIEWV